MVHYLSKVWVKIFFLEEEEEISTKLSFHQIILKKSIKVSTKILSSKTVFNLFLEHQISMIYEGFLQYFYCNLIK